MGTSCTPAPLASPSGWAGLGPSDLGPLPCSHLSREDPLWAPLPREAGHSARMSPPAGPA